MMPTGSQLGRVRRSLHSALQRHAQVVRVAQAASVTHSQRFHGQASSSSARGLHTTRVVAKKTHSDDNEAMLMQQMMDAMNFGDEEQEENTVVKKEKVQEEAQRQAGLTTLSVKGVVLNVKNNIASISGLRHATLGSVVAVYNRVASDDTENEDNAEADATLAHRVCRGVVLFLEKKVAHVALFQEGDVHHDAIRNVKIGMQVQVEETELRVPVSLARMAGRAVNALGEPIDLVYSAETTAQQQEDDQELPSANDRVSIAWGSKTVPSLMSRGPFREPFATGVLAIDCLKPLAYGHRFGILGPRNSGKTRLMLDILAQQIKTAKANGQEPPHIVYVCVAKSPMRVQQVLQFLEQTDALQYTTIVSADERDSLIMQYLAPFTGCAIAEYFMKHSKSKRTVVVYDDLATHTMVVENLVQTMKLPKISQLSLCAHAVLMERSAPFLKPTRDASLTAFALADTPDSTSGDVSEFMERVKSIVDDSVTLEANLARNRVYPPIDILQPGGSVRGAPFQSVAMWTYMNKIRTRINESFQVKESMDVAKHLGLEIEPEAAEVLEFQELVRQFFTQLPLKPTSKLEKEIGVFCLATLRVASLASHTTMSLLVEQVVQQLQETNPELLHLLERTHPSDKPWSKEMEDQVEAVLVKVLLEMRRHEQEQRKNQPAVREWAASRLRRNGRA